jgi:hypothetical protein
MKMQFFFLSLTVFLLSLQGCHTKSRVTVSTADPSLAVTATKAVDYQTFREAMQNVDLSYPETHPVTDQQKSFTEALQLILEGKNQQAEQALQQLHVSATDSLLRDDAEKILSTLQFYQSEWSALLQLDSTSGNSAENDNLILCKAFRTMLPEKYIFISPSARIPTTFTISGVPTLQVGVNGKRKKFLLDTGAGLSVISSEVAQECQIFPLLDQKAKAGTSTTKKVEIQPAVIEDLKIGDISIKNHPVIIIDQQDLEFKLLGLFTIMKIEGIIGWNAIQNLLVEIDYQNKIITLQKPGKFEVHRRNFFLMGGYPVVQLRSGEGIPLNFGLDTGARESWITDNLLKKLNQLSIASTTKTVGSAGGWEKMESKVLPELKIILNDYQLTFKKIGTRPAKLDEFVELDGVLGGDVFEKGRIRIDYQNGIFDLVIPDFPLSR